MKNNKQLRGIRVVITACLVVITQFMNELYVRTRSSSYSNSTELKRHTPSICENTKFSSTDVTRFWNTFSSEIIGASVSNVTTWYQDEQNNNAKFKHWLDALFETYYNTDEMIKSSIRSPDLDATLKVLGIISSRVKYLDEGEKGIPSPPLHILVTGGSLTSGMSCGENHVGIPKPGWMNEYRICAWPSRLEALFNQVLFQGEEVVKVSNLAVGGANSEVGKTLLEYQLFDDSIREQLPHIVIWAVSILRKFYLVILCSIIVNNVMMHKILRLFLFF